MLQHKALPVDWEKWKHHKEDEIRAGTRDDDTHPYKDNIFDNKHHTHCSECEEPFKETHHFFGDGMICDKCTLEHIFKESKIEYDENHECEVCRMMVDTYCKILERLQ